MLEVRAAFICRRALGRTQEIPSHIHANAHRTERAEVIEHTDGAAVWTLCSVRAGASTEGISAYIALHPFRAHHAIRRELRLRDGREAQSNQHSQQENPAKIHALHCFHSIVSPRHRLSVTSSKDRFQFLPQPLLFTRF